MREQIPIELNINILLLIIGIIFSMTVCSKGKIEPPERQKGIHESAFWAGGPDGGNWFIVAETGFNNIYHFTIYYDSTAEMITYSIFRTFFMQ